MESPQNRVPDQAHCADRPALCADTTGPIKTNKAQYLWVTVVPMVFVGVITLYGSYELFGLFTQKAATLTGHDAFHYQLNAALVAVVAVLAIIVLADSLVKWYGYLILKRPYTSTEVEHPELYRAPGTTSWSTGSSLKYMSRADWPSSCSVTYRKRFKHHAQNEQLV